MLKVTLGVLQMFYLNMTNCIIKNIYNFADTDWFFFRPDPIFSLNKSKNDTEIEIQLLSQLLEEGKAWKVQCKICVYLEIGSNVRKVLWKV